MMTIKDNLQHIHHMINEIAAQCERSPNLIKLLAVSKTKPVSLIEEAIQAGQTCFGENYVQEGVEKITHFQQHHPNLSLEWHFIGPLQSNKSKLVAQYFDWVQTIDRLKIATRLNEQRPSHLLPLNVLIQVNISDEESKSGIQPEDLTLLAQQIMALPHLKLRGLMAIPKAENDLDLQSIAFKKMYQLYQKLQQLNPDIDTLSMGMSDDMKAAIIAGTNMVRIGTAIFGARQYN